MCVDEESKVWFMLHSGSRGPGNRIGSVYIEIAKNEMLKLDKSLQVRLKCIRGNLRVINIKSCITTPRYFIHLSHSNE